MALNLITIAVVLGLAFVWANRGMFSALIHTACVIVAGAVAFALWEPVSVALTDASPSRGFFNYLGDASRGATLLVLFGATLLLCRLAADSLVKANVKLPFLANLIGGLAVALPGSIITAGIAVIGLSHINFGENLFGHKPVDYTERGGLFSGQLEHTSPMWLPADTLTAGFYGYVSERSFATSQPLARWYPDLALSGHTDRMTYDGSGRISIKSDDVVIESRYVVGDPAAGSAAIDVLGDRQQAMTLDAEPILNGRIEGFVLVFRPSAAESNQQLIFSPGPVRLVTENPTTGERLTLHPVATISENREQTAFERFPFEAKNQLISTVGADQSKTLAFEYFVPTGHEAMGLYARGLRLTFPDAGGADAEGDGPQVFASPAERNASIPLLMGGARLTSLDTSGAAELEQDGNNYPFVVTRNGLGVTLLSSNVKPALTLNDDNEIIDGEIRLEQNATRQRNVPSQLRVRNFGLPRGIQLVQVTVSGTPEENPMSLLNDTFRTSPPSESTLHLVDSQMRTYQPIGYIVDSGDWWDLRFTPATPMSTLRELPDADPSNPDGQTITLLFQVAVRTELTGIAINETALAVFDPPLVVSR